MSNRTGLSLPEYRVRAAIDCVHPPEAHNRIHDDDYARHHGFKSALVSGISLFAYMSRPAVELMGREWLEHGSAEMRIVHPVYEGDEIRVGGSSDRASEDGPIRLNCLAANSQGTVCGSGVFQERSAAPATEPAMDDYPAGDSELRRPIALETLEPGEPLTPIVSRFSWNVHWQYCQKAIRDHHPAYRRTMHPGWLLTRASRMLSANYAIPAWIDVSSQIQNFHLLEEESTVETRGRVQDRFECKGDHFIVMDLAVFAPPVCLATIRHTAIFRIAPNAA